MKTSSAASGSRRPPASTARTSPPRPARPFCEVANSAPADIELALDAAHAAAKELGQALGHRARGRPQRRRRRDRGEPRDARRRRELGERQARPRDDRRRHPARGRPFPLLRRGDPRRGGWHLRARRGHRRLPLPRAAGRRRADHPVQLPAADGGVEDRSGAGRGQLHRGQAGEPDTVVDPQARRGRSRTSSRPACSTSSTAPARRSGARWPRTSGSPRSRSPARR